MIKDKDKETGREIRKASERRVVYEKWARGYHVE